jgi:hypothetical protein
MKKPKWAKKLTKKELQHVKDAGPEGCRPLLRVAKANANNPHCFDCRIIGAKL